MNQTTQREKIAEGKTKIIWLIPGTNEVLIKSKDDITAGDGAKRDTIISKGILSTETTCNCFRLLNTTGVPTHFIERVDERTFRAYRVQMIPIELVARRIATGSYLRRNPAIKEETIFKELVIEFFLKDDVSHDPMMFWNDEKQCFEFYDAKKPKAEGYLKDLPGGNPLIPRDSAEVLQLSKLLSKTFFILEKAWRKQGVILVDLKIECGYGVDGTLLVADVIDNDSWRIWRGGNKAQMMDKQIYRDLKRATPRKLSAIKRKYIWVAEATAKFFV